MPGRKRLVFTAHAEDAVFERQLDRRLIEQAARQPEWSRPDPRRPGVEQRFRVIPEFGGRVLRVACLESDEEIRIITVFFDRNARKP